MTLRRFIECRRGNMAMILAICMVPLIVGIGAAVDYSRTVDTRERMQHSLDAAVLALSSEASKLTAEQVTARAKVLFDTNYSAGVVSDIKITATYTHTNGAVIEATATGTVAMTFMNIVGIKTQVVGVTSKSAWSSTRLRVALALDNTGSMNDNGKMDALKTATTNLIDKLKAQSSTDGDIYISIVPFNKDVNIGTSMTSFVNWTKKGRKCVWNSRYWRYDCADDYLWPSGKSTSNWKGCVSDRDKSLDISVAAPTKEAEKYPAEDYDACATALTPLSYNWDKLKSAVAAMQPTGATNQTIGLVWAWQSLKSTAPLNAPTKITGYDYQDVIILLSDGQNTMNRFAGNGSDPSSDVDSRMSLVCAAAKADNITIYTVLVIDGNETVLKNCASSASNYFNASSASDIITSFGAIGDKLSALRIAK